ASLSADGRPLKITRLAPGGATRVLASFALGYDDYRTWCGDRLVYVAGGGRIATQHKGLMVATAPVWRPPPLWRDPTRSFGAIARLGYSLGYYGHHDWPYTPADPPGVAFLHRGNLVVLDVATRTARIVLRHAGTGPVHWSGDGRFVSVGGRVAGGPTFPTDE